MRKGWNHFLKYESNKSQAWHRLRTQINDAFNDLILLANKLPNEEQSAVFDSKIIEKLMHSLLQLESRKKIEARKARLAATFAKVGLEYCKLHSNVSSKNSSLNELVENELMKAQIYCANIASDLERLQESEK